MIGSSSVPIRVISIGLRSKTSTPWRSPKSSNRSRPVACCSLFISFDTCMHPSLRASPASSVHSLAIFSPSLLVAQRKSHALGRDLSRLTSGTVKLRWGGSASLDKRSRRERSEGESWSRGGFGDGWDGSQGSAERPEYGSHSSESSLF